ncbi:MAG: hypothetical protein WC365_02580 [Candidatus Babeliales bacterium]|jgi:hypothetical protein
MPFWLHESRATLLFKGMPQGYKLSFTFIFSFLPLFIWLGLWYIPKRHKLYALESKKVAQEDQIKTLQKNVVRYDAALLKYDELHRKLSEQGYALVSLQEVVDAVLACMYQTAVTCRDIQQSDHAVKEFFTEYRFIAEGKGAFGNILAFIENLQRFPVPLVCESITLEEAKNQLVWCRLLLRVDLEHDPNGQSFVIPTFQVASHYVSMRNPFVMQTDDKRQHHHNNIVLEGIVSSGNGTPAALIAYGQERDIVTQGDAFHGYRLIAIDNNSVVVARGKLTKKLIIE